MVKTVIKLLLLFATIGAYSNTILAGDLGATTDLRRSLKLAQLDEAYDPFADYSEFDEATEEEADINFFRNGRFFTLGFLFGYRDMTGTMGEIYSGNFNFGLFLTYFFDLRFAMQFNFLSGSNTLKFDSPSGEEISGNADIQTMGLALKYYFNTQNVTRGLADLNPYVSGGLSTNTRTTTVSGESAFGRDNAMGFDVAAGVEIPMLRNKMHFGAQVMYQMVTFPDENTEIVVENGTESTGIYPRGDLIHVSLVLGINF
jgi:hypothetical protein